MEEGTPEVVNNPQPDVSLFGYNMPLLLPDLDREPIPRRTARGDHLHPNGMPEPGGYRPHVQARARQLEVDAVLERIRTEVLRRMTDNPMAFPDPISGLRCELVTGPEVGVRHPGCDTLADLAAHLDAFYCRKCRMNGRISGAWAIEMVRKKAHINDS